MSDPREFIERVETLAGAASPGPWHGEHDEFGCVSIGDYGWVTPGYHEYDVDSEQGRADAEFIAHARTVVPQLTAALRAVLDEHRESPDDGCCVRCASWIEGDADAQPILFACPTVRAITSALGGEDS